MFLDLMTAMYCLSKLKEAAERYGCDIHAYVLMTNHVHLLLTPQDVDGISRMMQYTCRQYVPYINHKYGKSGTLWEGRYKASLVLQESYLFRCMRYKELNPVRANMIKTLSHYRWSSYRYNAQDKANNMITSHHTLSTNNSLEQKKRDMRLTKRYSKHTRILEMKKQLRRHG